MNSSQACHLANSHFDNAISGFFIGNDLPVTVFPAAEIHHARVVALLPPARRFFSNVAVSVRNNVTSSKHAACKAIAGLSVMSQEFCFRVFPIRTKNVPITLDFDFLRSSGWV